MNILQVNALGGIKNQLYDSTQTIHAQAPMGISNGFFDINSLFWNHLFEIHQIEKLIQCAKLELLQDDSPKMRTVACAPKQFLVHCKEALCAIDGTGGGGLSEENLFNALETLEMVCLLYSRLKSAPFRLTISEGYVLSKYSALDMAQTCLLPFCNPYLDFIDQTILPAILEYKPDVLILSGAINLASFAIAKRMRTEQPDIFIVAADCETDYYSFEKISKLLVQNSALFSVYHCLVLHNLKSVKSTLARAERKITSNDLDMIPNLIYSLDGGSTIVRTPSRELSTEEILANVPCENRLCNIKVFPHNFCYWNRCSFCGINSKYTHKLPAKWDVPSAIRMIETLYLRGKTYFWFLDEAIPPSVIKCLCYEIKKKELNITWHMRTRIDPSLIGLAAPLFSVGLKHIIFGLESASIRVLNLMEKIDGSFDYLDIAEQIVSAYTSAGIQVHFSAILGFPTESESERYDTILFLDYLKKKYSRFSYNINAFYLDIGSKIYRKWENYDITSLSFPCSPKYYLENNLDWTSAVSSTKKDEIEGDRHFAMAQQYTWYPEDALVDPGTFYSFWEYSRLSILNEKVGQNFKQSIFKPNAKVRMNSNVCFCPMTSDSWLMYHLGNHHFIIGGEVLKNLIDAAQRQDDFSSILSQYKGVHRKAAKEVILQLYSKGFFA